MSKDQQLLFGIYFDALRMEDVVTRCRAALVTRGKVLLGVLNAAKIVNLRKDELLRNSLVECDLLLADGQSVVWASKLLRRPLPERVAGIDLFERLLELAHAEGHSVYLLGARPEVLARLQERLRERFPGLSIVGSHHGYFDTQDASLIASEIRESKADMLFLGMVSPRKEIFLGSFGSSLGVTVLHGVGGSFDVLAGYTRRAPSAWQRFGLEWAYRVLQEPRRLWWRYLTTNTTFIFLTMLELIRPADAFRSTKAGMNR
jgi:N-acetylglucosaminyldiphosphoundecaprenol N-acetyl-beta-D-mannosaminyltransferase